VSRQRIASVILAAGNSSRMGKPKALLKIGPLVFLETIFNLLGESKFDPIITVLGKDFKEIFQSIQKKRKILFLRNQFPEKGQLYSIQCGLKHVPGDVPGSLIVLVDHPLVSLTTYLTIHEAAQKYPYKIIIPVFEGKRGHPVYFSRKYFNDLLTAPLSEGARYVVQKYENSIMEMPVDDPGILVDIDTPEEYNQYLEKLAGFQ
jgi:molybdenum cofactor cytidylyltransferase